MSTPTRTPTGAPAHLTGPGSGGVGDDAQRPDGVLKVRGEFAYGSDLWMEDMLWGVTLRSPHPYARILAIDTSAAAQLPGVHAVLTSEDVPGEKVYGLELADQPVLAVDVVRYQGEPVALVAADHPETARRAASHIVVDYDVLEPVTDARVALGHGEHGPAETLHPEPTPVMELSREAAVLRPHGNLIRHLKVRKGDVEAARAQAHVAVS